MHIAIMVMVVEVMMMMTTILLYDQMMFNSNIHDTEMFLKNHLPIIFLKPFFTNSRYSISNQTLCLQQLQTTAFYFAHICPFLEQVLILFDDTTPRFSHHTTSSTSKVLGLTDIHQCNYTEHKIAFVIQINFC